MPLFLRQINLDKWKLDLESDEKWLAKGEIPADPVTDLETKENKLSVWNIGDDLNLISRTAAALTIRRQNIRHPFEYVLFDSEIINKTKIELEHSPGNTCDKELNDIHVNLKRLSAQKLVRFTDKILKETPDENFERENPQNVCEHILEGISKGWINVDGIHDNIKNRLDKYFGPDWRKKDIKSEVSPSDDDSR